VPFLWLWEEHRRQRSWIDFAGHCLWLLPLRLAAVVPLLLPQNSLLTSLDFTLDWEAVWATRIFLMVPPQVLFIFFWSLLDTHNHLPCLDYSVCLGTVSET
jgi:hypothetical protein